MLSPVSKLLALAVVLLSGIGCGRQSPAFTLDIETLRELSPETTAGISYEVDDGTVLVTVIDKHGDGHIHRLVLGNTASSQALKLLDEKQAELGRRK
jgi:predicted amidohydrolase